MSVSSSLIVFSSLIYFMGFAIGLRDRHTQSEPMAMHTPNNAPCSGQNLDLKAFLHKAGKLENSLLPNKATTLDEFVHEVKEALDANQLGTRALDHLFSGQAEFHPTCNGLWMEFGVFAGHTVNQVASWREKHCSPGCPAVHGFDTFEGLPEAWSTTDGETFKKGFFSQQGQLPAVRPNVNLVKGLFSESLPAFLKKHAAYCGDDSVVSFLHVDCDLYAGTKDIFHFLAPKLIPGTVILFDELVNYKTYKEHEIKAFWEYLTETGTKVAPLGMFGPLPDSNEAVRLEWDGKAAHISQSAAFVIVQQKHHPRQKLS